MKNNNSESNSKGIIIGLLIGVLAAALSAVGVVFLLSSIDGGKNGTISENITIESDDTDNVEADVDSAIDEENSDSLENSDFAKFTDDYSLICGVDNKAQLAYLLGIAEACDGNDWNKLRYALGEIWYEKELAGVYSTVQSAAASDNQIAYNLDDLNKLYSFITDEKITNNTVPTVATISGNELLYKYNDSVSASKFEIVIKDIEYKDADKMYIEYLYKIVNSANRDGGIYGISIAICEPDDNGEFKLTEIERKSRQKYSRDIVDSDFAAEFEALKQ